MHPVPTRRRGRPYPLLLALVAACTALQYPTDARALVIDNFEEGDFDLTATLSVDPGVTLPGLSTGNVIGGERRVDVVQNGGSGTVSAALATSAFDDTMNLLFDAPGTGTFVSGFVRLTYGLGTALDANLLADGADRFRIDVVDASLSTTPSFANLSVSLQSGTGTSAIQFGFSQQTFTGVGLYEFSFGAFGAIDFSDVDSIEVTFGNIGFDGPNSVTLSVDGIDTNGTSAPPPTGVPEPATLALLGVAGVMLARRPRR